MDVSEFKPIADQIGTSFPGLRLRLRIESNGHQQEDTKMKVITLCSMLLCGISIASAADTDPPSPDIAAFIGQVTIPAGSSSASVTIVAKVPSQKKLVIQTVSIFRVGVVAGSILNSFLMVTANQIQGYFALPSAVADGSPYPSSTLSATIYATNGTSVLLSVYRSGSDSAQEEDNVVLHGYYVAAP